ncbi:membrane protein [Streptomyces spiroverticillatus]|uniref:Membrane protein n=1 Tax=Streptomyces finlayi TaxID=67296 RepID=A0A919CA85_9ACTN|nr:ABC transporter permease [Streptomyces finlayi]GHA11715.1 membrane protein [Streptomyces spiroverticillatus]GHC94882.1 membrane protein [Streptomyces finlayi]
MSHRAVAPWVRTRLRSAPGAAVALGVLVLITAFLAASYPRAVDRYEDAGLRHALRTAPADQRIVQVASDTQFLPDSDRILTPEQLLSGRQNILKTLSSPLAVDLADSAYGVRSPKPLVGQDKWLPRLSLEPAELALSTRSDLAKHSQLVQGRAAAYRPPPPGEDTSAEAQLEGVVTTATARDLRIKVGAVLHLQEKTGSGTVAVKVTGIVQPLRTDSLYWDVRPEMHTPVVKAADLTGDTDFWSAEVLLPLEAGPVLARLGALPITYWDFAPRTDDLISSDAGPLTSVVASLESGPAQSVLRERTNPTVSVTTDLEALVTGHLKSRSVIDPVVAVAGFGVGTVAAVVLLMAGALAAARRHSELALLRARGGSVRGMAGRLSAELAVMAVPAAAVGWLAAFLLLPGARTTASVLAAAAVAALAVAGLPVRAALAHLRPKAHGDRADLVRAKPSRRRTVVELTFVVLTAGAVAALNRRGTGSGVDGLVSAAPVLVAVIASFVLVRLYPLPLRLVARPLALRRGVVGFLAAARSGRAPATATLPLLALLIALSTAAFGGSVLAGVSDSRDRAATVTVGGDALVRRAGSSLDAKTVAAVQKATGVREISPVGIDYRLSLQDFKPEVTLVAVDSASYAKLSRRTGIGVFDPKALAPQGKVFPVLASPKTAKRLAGKDRELRSVHFGYFTARLGGTLTATPVMDEREFLVIDKAALADFRPTTLMITGSDLDRKALQAAAGRGTEVKLRTEERAALSDPPLQKGAEQVYAAAIAAGAGFAVLAVLLSLLQSSPERAALLARLRTMGLTRGQSRKLLVFESLPQALLAACGGALVGWAAIELLAPNIDLAALALATHTHWVGTASAPLRTDGVSLLVPAVAVVCIAIGVAALQAWWTTRRTTTTELRAGDAR